MGCTFGQRIRFLRKKKSWLIIDFAKKLELLGNKITLGYINQVELYNKIPSPEMVGLMIKALRCNRNEANTLVVLAKQGKLEQFREKILKKYNPYIR